jgi:hypothetical protein
VDADGVAGLEPGHLAQLGALDRIDDVAHGKGARRPTARLAKTL